MSTSKTRRTHTVADLSRVMDQIAPTGLAQDWDNVGLLLGDPTARVKRALLCIDLTPSVVDEAVRKKVDLVLAYHPPIFKPITRLLADSSGTDAAVYRCARRGIAIYATHTALDASDDGPNAVIASMCGIAETEPIEYVDEPGESQCKVVVFVPEADLARVSAAMFSAGAGHIGDYSHCSFQSPGQGSFLGSDATNPTLGKRGKFEKVNEVRLETVVTQRDLPAVLKAMIGAHSYEEPAFDIYPLGRKPVRGMGRVGKLPRRTSLGTLARKLKRATAAACVQIVGTPSQGVGRVIILVGAAGSIPFALGPSTGDVIVTGEIRHHDALEIQRRGCSAIALGHWSSERPVLASLADRLRGSLPGLNAQVSRADRDPFRPI